MALKNVTRRGVIKGAEFGALGLGVLGGGTLAWRRMYPKYKREHDLSMIGKGKPVVVQVHDPQCRTCTPLQRETRKALKGFGECDQVYLIADITQVEGQVFARTHVVPHVTLMLLDGDGGVVQALSGMRRRVELQPVFATHFERYGVKV
jgi:hypothetical protein